MEFQLRSFKSKNMMLWKCCTQYANKFGKPSISHRTGQGEFSFPFQIKQWQKCSNPQNCSHFTHWQSNAQNSPNLGSNSTCTEKFQKFKLNLEKTEEPEINFHCIIGKKKENSTQKKKNISIFPLSATPKPLTVWIRINCRKFLKGREYQTTLPAS